ncbi:unnamed protein product [Coffea canephora]|uniref:TPD1 protein homolog 1-like n=1 Tax=Coffea canephora TaxID=49390 RepID=A0A068TRC0_COFCA|nr:unnamed protein product [Coffea canephora]
MRPVAFVLFSLFIVIIIVCSIQFQSGKSCEIFHEDGNRTTVIEPGKAYLKHRKFLIHDFCSNRDISISQSMYSTSGIPQYIVQIVNTCISGCAPSKIHLHCGWFASAKLVNPRTFRRLSYDDCLVNGGKPLRTGQIIRFTYSNSFMYPLSFKSAKFC